jgi:glycine cleavage system H protein
LYTKKHEWAREEAGLLVVGITDYAQISLGDIVYVDVKAAGSAIEAEASFGAIESVKAAEDLYAPVKGVIAEVNKDLNANPSQVNSDPYAAWLIKLKDYDAGALAALMNATAYADYLKTLA